MYEHNSVITLTVNNLADGPHHPGHPSRRDWTIGDLHRLGCKHRVINTHESWLIPSRHGPDEGFTWHQSDDAGCTGSQMVDVHVGQMAAFPGPYLKEL